MHSYEHVRVQSQHVRLMNARSESERGVVYEQKYGSLHLDT